MSDQVMRCYVEDLFALKPKSNKILAEVFDYICANYLDDSYFPRDLWANMQRTGDRTTKCRESFHAKLNAGFTSEANTGLHVYRYKL